MVSDTIKLVILIWYKLRYSYEIRDIFLQELVFNQKLKFEKKYIYLIYLIYIYIYIYIYTHKHIYIYIYILIVNVILISDIFIK